MPYKCLMDNFGELSSAVTTVPEARVGYPLGEWAEAQEPMRERGYHLTYFEQLEDALGFMRPGSVYYCEVEGIVGDIPRPPFSCSMNLETSAVSPPTKNV